MIKRFLIIVLCLTVTIFLASVIFSQDDPTPTDEKKVEDTEDKSKDDATKEGEKKDEGSKEAESEDEAEKIEKSTQQTLEAKTFFDGIKTYVNSKVQFKLSSKDNLLTDKMEYKIDTGEAKAYEGPFSIAEEGKHVIIYYSTDKIGNKEDEKRFKVVVDNTPPMIVVTSSKPVLRYNEKIYISKDCTLSIISKDDLSGVNKIDYSLNGTDYQEYVAPFNISSQGDVQLKVRAIDNVTNQGEDFKIKLFDESGKAVDLKESVIKMTTDNTPPTVEIKPDKELKKKENKNIASDDVKFTVKATDTESGVASVLIRVDGKGDFVPYMSEINFTTNGEHTIEAKAIDKVGNASSVSILSIYVDIIPPETKIETITK